MTASIRFMNGRDHPRPNLLCHESPDTVSEDMARASSKPVSIYFVTHQQNVALALSEENTGQQYAAAHRRRRMWNRVSKSELSSTQLRLVSLGQICSVVRQSKTFVQDCRALEMSSSFPPSSSDRDQKSSSKQSSTLLRHSAHPHLTKHSRLSAETDPRSCLFRSELPCDELFICSCMFF